tara:strand:+ start:390 stop:686 length:297 start_codon:yes stop_codon:yes gene_type:complete
MNTINYVESIPTYINDFIKLNIDNIRAIYNQETQDGYIYINVNQKENKVDICFLNLETMKKTFNVNDEFIENMNKEDHGKIKVFILDMEINESFIIFL